MCVPLAVSEPEKFMPSSVTASFWRQKTRRLAPLSRRSTPSVSAASAGAVADGAAAGRTASKIAMGCSSTILPPAANASLA